MDVLMYIVAILAIGLVIYMLIRKADIKITLFGTGIILLYIALLMGRGFEDKNILNPLHNVIDAFKSILPRAGFIILILGGYTSYMSAIGANEVTVYALTKPLKGIKSQYFLVPIVFLLGNVLSLVIPSASNLAIILLATLYPVLKKSGMSTLTAAAVIATTATVMPTPLGGDNVAIAAELGMDVATYVFSYHAIVSVPTLLFMAVAHYFWQKYSDKKDTIKGVVQVEELQLQEIKEVKGSALYKTVYTLLPLLPIVLLLALYGYNLIPGTTDISM